MLLHPAPNGPQSDDAERLARAREQHLMEVLESLLERMLCTPTPLPEWPLLNGRHPQLLDLQREVWYCHWGVVVSLCVYQQLISHVGIEERQAITRAVGAALARSPPKDGETLYGLIEGEFARHGVGVRPDMDMINRELSCNALQSSVLSYIMDIAVKLIREEAVSIVPQRHTFIALDFFQRFAGVARGLLGILQEGAYGMPAGPV
jgi:hypothetical protein